jgi:hypothetical protein
MKARKGLAGAMLAAMITLGATPAMAGTSAALLKRLHEKGILSDEEYQQLLREDEADQAAPPAAAPAVGSGATASRCASCAIDTPIATTIATSSASSMMRSLAWSRPVVSVSSTTTRRTSPCAWPGQSSVGRRRRCRR